MASDNNDDFFSNLFPNSNPSELFRSAFECVPEPLMLIGAVGRVFLINRAFEQLTGNSLAQLRNRELTSLCFLARESQAVELQAGFWEGEVGWPDAHGQVLLLRITSVALGNEREQPLGYLLSFQPIQYRDTSLLDQRSNRQQRLESLGSLAGGIAHDLNNVLTGVLGHVSYLRLSLPPRGIHSESLVAIEDGARRAASMTHQILEFARGTGSEQRGVNLSLVVSAGVNLLRAALPKNVELEVHGSEVDITVFGDESQLSQLVMNLAVNARDALPLGGTIVLTLDLVELDGVDKALVPGTYAKLEIQDNGIGIPDDIKDRIFEPFFTTKTEGGTGLGLSTVFAIVQRHCGLIEVESKEGAGTIFRVLLPVYTSTESLAKPESPAESNLPTGSERILVVDDEESVRLVIQRSLEHLGYRVDIAASGVEALQRYSEKKTEYKLIILDMMMPQMPGDELFGKLRTLDPQVPVLIASGYSSDHRTKAILDAGGRGFIKKPFAVEELAREVRRCLDMDHS